MVQKGPHSVVIADRVASIATRFLRGRIVAFFVVFALWAVLT